MRQMTTLKELKAPEEIARELCAEMQCGAFPDNYEFYVTMITQVIKSDREDSELNYLRRMEKVVIEMRERAEKLKRALQEATTYLGCGILTHSAWVKQLDGSNKYERFENEQGRIYFRCCASLKDYEGESV